MHTSEAQALLMGSEIYLRRQMAEYHGLKFMIGIILKVLEIIILFLVVQKDKHIG